MNRIKCMNRGMGVGDDKQNVWCMRLGRRRRPWTTTLNDGCRRFNNYEYENFSVWSVLWIVTRVFDHIGIWNDIEDGVVDFCISAFDPQIKRGMDCHNVISYCPYIIKFDEERWTDFICKHYSLYIINSIITRLYQIYSRTHQLHHSIA